MTQNLDVLSLPLNGLRIIEASAGTGKTWTLSALYVRLVLGHGLPPAHAVGLNPPDILVMTFTEMATAELRGRIRARLHEAALYFQTPQMEDPKVDDFLKSLKSTYEPSLWPHCAKRLDLAAQWMDEAAIFTIHAWSARMLKEHAFESKSLFEQSLSEDSQNLKLAAAEEYWRKFLYPLTAQQLLGLRGYPKTPEELLDKLKNKFVNKNRLPNAVISVGLAPQEVLKSWDNFQEKYDAVASAARDVWTAENSLKIESVLRESTLAKTIKGYRLDWLGGWLSKMQDWQAGAEIELKILERFSLSKLQSCGWEEAHEIAGLSKIDALCEVLQEMPKIDIEELFDHAAHEIDLLYERSKAEAGQFDFSDLLKNLYIAVNADDSRLATTIRKQYPVALVDEFQDTDPWQYGTLKKIYVQERADHSGLIIIGDPKQAIYGFRGADLDTYLSARGDAQKNIYTLPKNYRSTQGLVSAVNHIFSVAVKPFKDIDFFSVEAAVEIEPLKLGSAEQPAMTVWYANTNHVLNKDTYNRVMSSLFASQIVNLLNAKAAQPNEMAVLVRDFKEANAIRQALAQLGVRSVYLSDKESVFASEQARELRLILMAVAHPKSTNHLRCAVTTKIWGLSLDNELEQLIHHEESWQALIDRFHIYQAIWQKQGFLPMLHRLIHENQIAHKLLTGVSNERTNGERVLTNLLHLGDLLQAASLKVHGEEALIRYLEEQLRDPQSSGESAVLRLESEANLVKIITIHKSKGLEFPLVFLPFISNFKPENAHSDRSDQSRIEEDIRLLYVALTRAQRALWMGLAPMVKDFNKKSNSAKSAVSVLLNRQNSQDLASQLSLWSACPHIVVSPAPTFGEQGYTGIEAVVTLQGALTPKQKFTSNWWTASFSSISKGSTREEGHHFEPVSSGDEKLADSQVDNFKGVDDDLSLTDAAQREPGTAGLASPSGMPSPYDEIPSSSLVGTLLHDLLEWQFKYGWPITAPSLDKLLQSEWSGMLEVKLLKLSLGEEVRDLLVSWIHKIVKTKYMAPDFNFPLSSLSLCEMNMGNAWAEMGFTLPVKSMEVARLDTLITNHVLAHLPRPSLIPKQMNGMLTGFMDLVFESEGRYYVLDYKSNRLKGYSNEDLQASILSHRYDVQYTLYLLALHRLLKSRLDDYDYDEHVGGAIYLFLRGVQSESQGVFVDRPPKALILALDEAFKGP